MSWVLRLRTSTIIRHNILPELVHRIRSLCATGARCATFRPVANGRWRITYVPEISCSRGTRLAVRMRRLRTRERPKPWNMANLDGLRMRNPLGASGVLPHFLNDKRGAMLVDVCRVAKGECALSNQHRRIG
jgi:hypothetical protein